MSDSQKLDDEVLHFLWLLYRKAIVKHVESAPAASAAAYHERAEKAGIAAVVEVCREVLK